MRRARWAGEERRHGGDRDHGQFGPLRSAYVPSEAAQPYGQWLQDEWKLATFN
jgi:hypothetical protein